METPAYNLVRASNIDNFDPTIDIDNEGPWIIDYSYS